MTPDIFGRGMAQPSRSRNWLQWLDDQAVWDVLPHGHWMLWHLATVWPHHCLHLLANWEIQVAIWPNVCLQIRPRSLNKAQLRQALHSPYDYVLRMHHQPYHIIHNTHGEQKCRGQWLWWKFLDPVQARIYKNAAALEHRYSFSNR